MSTQPGIEEHGPRNKGLTTVYQRLADLRWPIVIIVIGAAAIHQALLFVALRFFPPDQQSLVHLAVYSLTGIAVVWIGLRQLAKATRRQEEAEAELQTAYRELERTHRQLQIIHQVGRRVTNATDLQELLDIAARIPVELLGARGTSVITFGNGSDRGDLEVTWGLSEDAVQVLRREVETNFSAERCRSCQPLTAHVDNHCPLLTSLQDTSDAEGIGQIVCLPLGRGEDRSGVVTAYLPEDTGLSDEETRLVSIVAAEITAALDSARLRTRQMATLYAVDKATKERRNLDTLLHGVLSTTVAGWGAQAGAILLIEDDGTSWSIRAHQDMGHDLSSQPFGLALRLAEKARGTGQPVILQERAGDLSLASVATVLLQTEGEILGALFLASSQPGYFKPAQTELMKAVGSQIALAARNAQLYSQLRQTAVLEERYRLSREMHDGVAQTLGYLGMQAERLEQRLDQDDPGAVRQELRELRNVIGEAYLDVREAIDGLRLTVDHPGGFVGALQAHVEDFRLRTGIAVDCSGVECPGDLPPDVALHLLRITQEALSNIRRHADASHVWIHLIRENGHLELTVADDGQGFDRDNRRDRHHIGLASMRERMHSVNGQLTLATSPGQGTRVTARVPVN